MTRKPDDRSDNVERLQNNIDNTLKNMDRAEETLDKCSNPQQKRELEAKNQRRAQALDGFRNEIRDEAAYRQQQQDEQCDDQGWNRASNRNNQNALDNQEKDAYNRRQNQLNQNRNQQQNKDDQPRAF